MKKFLMLLILLCSMAMLVQAQTVNTTAPNTIKKNSSIKVDPQGNYHFVKIAGVGAMASYKDTGKTFTDSKGTTYPVYQSTSGKLFVIKTSQRTGNQYKYYLQI